MQRKNSLLSLCACLAVAVAVGCFLSSSKAEAQIQQIHPGESIFITQTHHDGSIRYDCWDFCGGTVDNRYSVIAELADLNFERDKEYVLLFQYVGNQVPHMFPDPPPPYISPCCTGVSFGLAFTDVSYPIPLEYFDDLLRRQKIVKIDQFFRDPTAGGPWEYLRSRWVFYNIGPGYLDYPVNEFAVRIVYDSTRYPPIMLYFDLEGYDFNLLDDSWLAGYWPDSIFTSDRQRMVAFLWSVSPESRLPVIPMAARVTLLRKGQPFPRVPARFSTEHSCGFSVAGFEQFLPSGDAFVFPTRVKPGEQIEVSARLVDALALDSNRLHPLVNKRIEVSVAGRGVSFRKAATTNSDGVVKFYFDIPTNPSLGLSLGRHTYSVTLRFDGDNIYLPVAITKQFEVVVEKKPIAWILAGNNKMTNPIFGIHWTDWPIGAEVTSQRIERFLKDKGYDVRFQFLTSTQQLGDILSNPWTKAVVIFSHMRGGNNPVFGLHNSDITVTPRDIENLACPVRGRLAFDHIHFVSLEGCNSLAGDAERQWSSVFPNATLLGWKFYVYHSFIAYRTAYHFTYENTIPPAGTDPTEIVYLDADINPAAATGSCPAPGSGELPTHLLPWGIPEEATTNDQYPIAGLPENGSVNIFLSQNGKPTSYPMTLYISDKQVKESILPTSSPTQMMFVEQSLFDSLFHSPTPFTTWQEGQAQGLVRVLSPYPLTKVNIPMGEYMKAGCIDIAQEGEQERICWEAREDITDSKIAATIIAALITMKSRNAIAFNIGDTLYLMSKEGKAIGGTITSVGVSLESIPSAFVLHQNYPNPFNPTTTIRFSLPQREHVTLKVFDVLGREVARLLDQELEAGEHTVVFDAGDLPSGVYFYRMQAGAVVQLRKMEVVR
ncbi:MAG: hypothetical protein KatS3mg109_1735 [Pirellulaceae bacterium]|nr:MAG: hypothetical protein KatS3mg109_1735 [Pirellulaceae bacterium]